MTRVLVTGAGGSVGANLTRCLREAPESMHVVGTEANRWHLPLSRCETTYLIPHASERAAYAAALAEVIDAQSVEVVIPGSPHEVRAVAELKQHLGAKVALPRPSVLRVNDDRMATYQRLLAASIAVPATRPLHNLGDIEVAFSELDSGPLWIVGTDANDSGLGAAGHALQCTSVAFAQAWIEHHDGWGRMCATEHLPGARMIWTAGFVDGTLMAAATCEVLAQTLAHLTPSGQAGIPAVFKTIARADVAETGERAVQAIDDMPHGVYSVELTDDESGCPRVVRIRAGRCDAAMLAMSEAGYNFPWLLVRIARGDTFRALPEPNQACEEDVYWIRTLDCGPATIRGERGLASYPRAGGV